MTLFLILFSNVLISTWPSIKLSKTSNTSRSSIIEKATMEFGKSNVIWLTITSSTLNSLIHKILARKTWKGNQKFLLHVDKYKKIKITRAFGKYR